MNISYYTIDDLRLPAKRLLRKGRSVEQFPTLEEALARYRALPAAGIRGAGTHRRTPCPGAGKVPAPVPG